MKVILPITIINIVLGIIIGIVILNLPVVESPTFTDDHETHTYSSTPRGSCWKKARQTYISTLKHVDCEWCYCDSIKNLNVHHIIPFHERPDLECVQSNLILLCREHHFTEGHRCPDGGSNWADCSNPDIAKCK